MGPGSSPPLDPPVAPWCPQGKVPTWPPRRVRPSGLSTASAHSSLRIAALAFQFLKQAMRLPALGFLHTPSPMPAASFHPFCPADSHSSLGSQPQHHFLCEALLSCHPSLNPPIKRFHRSPFLYFMSRGVLFVIGPFVWLFDYVCLRELHGGRDLGVCCHCCVPSTAPVTLKMPS